MQLTTHQKPSREKADRRGRVLIVLAIGVGSLATVAWIAFLVWLLFF